MPAHELAIAFITNALAEADKSGLVLAEIGIDYGATSSALAAFLGNEGELHLYDYESKTGKIVADLAVAGYTNVRGFGCSEKTLDSYNWQLMQVLKDNPRPIYDYVFLDGAHTWAHDALAFCLIDKLLKPGGFIHFDDYAWTIAASPTVNPTVKPHMAGLYTAEQMSTPQVALVVELLVRRDPRYEEVVRDAIFVKRRV